MVYLHLRDPKVYKTRLSQDKSLLAPKGTMECNIKMHCIEKRI
jgi:hypothetical protein